MRCSRIAHAQSAEILSGCRPIDWKMHICISQLKGKKKSILIWSEETS